MNENQTNQEKDFRSLIGQFNLFSETRDKQINEIDNILDRIKRNRRPSDGLIQNIAPVSEEPDIITQLRTFIHKMDLANEKLQAISNRINELA